MNEDSEVRFTSREGSIDLSLSVGGGVSLSDAVSIKAGSREGNVAVNVVNMDSTLSCGCEAHFRTLDIVNTAYPYVSECPLQRRSTHFPHTHDSKVTDL